MTPDPMRYWQDSDDPDWSDETEARFITELGMWNMEHALRPRDEFDVDVDPETYRGKVLAFYDAMDDVRARIAALPWYRRWPLVVLARLRGIRL
jgi:hypothetical protein